MSSCAQHIDSQLHAYPSSIATKVGIYASAHVGETGDKCIDSMICTPAIGELFCIRQTSLDAERSGCCKPTRERTRRMCANAVIHDPSTISSAPNATANCKYWLFKADGCVGEQGAPSLLLLSLFGSLLFFPLKAHASVFGVQLPSPLALEALSHVELPLQLFYGASAQVWPLHQSSSSLEPHTICSLARVDLPQQHGAALPSAQMWIGEREVEENAGDEDEVCTVLAQTFPSGSGAGRWSSTFLQMVCNVKCCIEQADEHNGPEALQL